MTILTLDTETQGLDTHKFVMGTVCDKQGRCKSFYDKKKLWAYLVEYIEKHARWQECLYIYAHNMHYDFLVIAPSELPRNYELYCHTPYIVDVKDDKGRICAKFLSTTSLYRGSLAEMGNDMGYPKGITPEWLTQDVYKPDFIELNLAREYMENDAKIVMKYVDRLREFLKNNGITTRMILTAGQIGIQYYMHHLRTNEYWHDFVTEQGYKGELHKTQYPEELHEALRGGRVQAMEYGHFEKVHSIDINSHYPDCLKDIAMPNLRTERKVENPLHQYSLCNLFSYIGISNCVVRVKKGKFGVLPVRGDNRTNHYPNEDGQLIFGTWSHIELCAARERGYEIVNIYWSILWEESINPFEFIEDLANKRLLSTDNLEKYFLKMLMNAGIGKFSQRRKNMTYKWVEIGSPAEYDMAKNAFCAVEESGHYRLYCREGDYVYKRFYAPIIGIQVTALGRIRLLEAMEKCPQKVLYCDTDGFVIEGSSTNKFKYSKHLGGFKLEYDDVPALIYGRKHYMIADEIKMSGVGKLWRDKVAFAQGKVTYKKMITELMSQDQSLIGSFREEERDLQQITREAIAEDAHLAEQELFVDEKNIADVAKIQADICKVPKDYMA